MINYERMAKMFQSQGTSPQLPELQEDLCLCLLLVIIWAVRNTKECFKMSVGQPVCASHFLLLNREPEALAKVR